MQEYTAHVYIYNCIPHCNVMCMCVYVLDRMRSFEIGSFHVLSLFIPMTFILDCVSIPQLIFSIFQRWMRRDECAGARTEEEQCWDAWNGDGEGTRQERGLLLEPAITIIFHTPSQFYFDV